jgi:hypothetical protein
MGSTPQNTGMQKVPVGQAGAFVPQIWPHADFVPSFGSVAQNRPVLQSLARPGAPPAGLLSTVQASPSFASADRATHVKNCELGLATRRHCVPDGQLVALVGSQGCAMLTPPSPLPSVPASDGVASAGVVSAPASSGDAGEELSLEQP